MRISDWSSDVCSSDLETAVLRSAGTAKCAGLASSAEQYRGEATALRRNPGIFQTDRFENLQQLLTGSAFVPVTVARDYVQQTVGCRVAIRSEERRVGKEWVSTVISRCAQDN